MKYILFILLILHGAIHLMGFAKAFGFAEIETIRTGISKTSGMFWLLAFALFAASAVALLAKADWWFFLSFAAVLISTILIITVWKDARYGTIANLIILAAAIAGYSTANYYNYYQKEVKATMIQSADLPVSVLTEQDIATLPEPVKNYIRYTGSVGKPKVGNFRLEFTGKIRSSEKSGWMPFTTEQYNSIDASTRLFFMNAVMKGLPVAGFHSFKNGDAFMDIRLLSLLKVQYQSGKEMGIAETVTFFNDMCCMAPATLIDKRITWPESDSSKVKAVFTNNGITVSAWLYFNEKGELFNFVSDDRFAAGENNTMKRIRWSTPMKDYRVINGYRLASYAEAVYSYPEGDFCYGTFSLKNIRYNTYK